MSECIEWRGYRNRDGYGVLHKTERRWLAHRLAWTEQVGDIPAGMYVCHTCDNPACVNVDHLFIGTHKDNMADKIAKGRARPPQGEGHHRAKLSDDDVRAIRASSEPAKNISQQYGISLPAVYNIRNRKRWTHI